MPRPPVQRDLGDQPPERTLRTVRRAQVGRWWLQVKPVDAGFQAVAHTLSGLPAVWVGPVRATLAEATDDAIAEVAELEELG